MVLMKFHCAEDLCIYTREILKSCTRCRRRGKVLRECKRVNTIPVCNKGDQEQALNYWHTDLVDELIV